MTTRGVRGARIARLLTLLVVLVASACGGLPTDSAVHTGQQVGSSDEADQPIRVLPPPPAPGETPEEIVHGFLRAQGSDDNNHEIARRFLAPGTKWDATVGAGIYDPANLQVGVVVDGAVPVSVTLQARIDQVGAYTLAAGTVQESYRVVRVKGEWRLADVPDGLLLTTADAGRLYQPQDIYFLAPPDLDVLVPDRRFLPAAPKTLVPVLVRALLAGPSSWLAPAVATAMPGVRLRSVTIQNGVVAIDLAAPARHSSARDRTRLSAQLIWTLKHTGIRGMRLLAGGQPLSVGGSTRVQTLDEWQSYDPNVVTGAVPAYYARADELQFIDDAGHSESAGTGHLTGLAGRPLESPAISLGSQQLAGLARRSDGGVDLLVGTSLTTLSVRKAARSFTAPSWGSGHGAVWTVAVDARTGAQRVLLATAAPSGGVQGISAPGLEGVGPVRSFRVSRGGTRVAVIAGAGTAAQPRQLYLGRVVVTSGARSVEALRSITPSLHDPLDVAWSSADTLVVLASKTSEGSALPWVVTLDGSSLSPVTTGGLFGPPSRIAAAPDRPLVVEAADDAGHAAVYRAGGGAFSLVGPGQDPAYPG